MFLSKRFFVISILLLSFFSVSVAQVSQWQWAKTIGGIDNDVSNAICTNKFGHIYVTGRYTSTCQFNSLQLTSIGGPDIFVAQYDRNGICLWANSAGSYDNTDPVGDEGKGVGADAFGNCYVTGTFYDSARFNNIHLNGNGNRQIFVAKYNSGGNLVWVKEPNGNHGNNYSKAIAVDSIGNSYITGYLGGGTNNFGSYSLSGAGGYVVKYDSSGNTIYATKLGTGGLYFYGIAVDRFGNSYLTGYLQNIETINSIVYTSNGYRDWVLIKLDSAGVFSWMIQSTTNDSSSNSDGSAISIDSKKDRINVVGNYDSPITIAGTTIPISIFSNNEFLVAQFDLFGNLKWIANSSNPNFSSSSNDGFAIAYDRNSNVYVTGVRYDEVYFGNCYLPNNGIQTFVVCYDSLGGCSFSNTSTNGNTGAFGYGISVESEDCAVYITGFSKAPTAFGNDTTINYGMEDSWIAKLSCDSISNSVSDFRSDMGGKIEVNNKILTLTLSRQENIRVEIYNMIGSRIIDRVESNQTIKIDLDYLDSGIYVLVVENENQIIYTYKIRL